MKPFCVVFVFLLWLGYAIASWASEPHGPLVIILLPGTNLTDWRNADAPTLHRIMKTGALAVMNTRTARLPNDRHRETSESAALTLGAGSRAAGDTDITAFHPAPELAPGLSITYGALYARRMGLEPALDSEVNSLWPRVLENNHSLGYDLLPGNLADGLKKHGIAISAGGGRLSAAVACGSDGVVSPFVRGGHLPHPLPPCLVWDAGPDIGKAEDIITAATAAVLAARGRLMILSPDVSDPEFTRGERLSPVVIWGEGVPASLLYSPSTRRAGLIASTDVAPSVAEYFGATPNASWLPVAAFGRPFEFRPTHDAVKRTFRIEADAYRQARGMKWLPYVAICLGLLLAIGIMRQKHISPSAPLVWLPGLVIFSLLVSPAPEDFCLWIGTLAAILLVLKAYLGATTTTLLLSAGIVLVLTADTLTGNRLMTTCLLGYSAVEGARYYGIGNEAMGALVGSALVIAAHSWSRSRYRPAILIALSGLALLLGSPSEGAKFGGLLVAVAGFAAFAWTAWGRQWDWRTLTGIISVMLLSLVLMSIGDLRHPHGSQTHVGEAWGRIQTGGVQEAFDIITRKLAVERRLLYHSAWAVSLWISMIGLSGPFALRTFSEQRQVKALRRGGLAAVVVCLVGNDAGAVAAALCGTLVLTGLWSLETEKRPASAAEAV